jgi:phosphoribosylglycinamide formyltransferase-1
MSAPLKVAVLISGRGSNLKALIAAARDPKYPAEVALVVSNVAGAPGLEHAKDAGIATRVVDHRAYKNRAQFDAAMTVEIEAAGASLVCLAGFMRILSDPFVARWRDKLVNIHPSLLPAFKGLDVHRKAIEAGARFSGCTVHFVRAGVDEGPIVVQAAVPVAADDTPESLAARVLAQEHIIYPLAVRLIAEGRVRVAGERVLIDGASAPTAALINPTPG